MKVITLNLKATDSTATLKKRLLPLINFINSKNVDVIMVQEAPGGIVQWTKGNCFNAVKYIASEVGYNYVDCKMTGYSLLWNIRLGIISKYNIENLESKNILDLPTVDFEDFKFDEDHLLPWTRKIIGARIAGTAVFCTHLGYEKGNDGFISQAGKTVLFMNDFMRSHGCLKAILGGDMNYNIYDPPNVFHTAITNIGFKEVQDGILDIQTYGVNDNPYGSGVINRPYKIDCIYLKNMKALNSSVVFNTPGSFVSDHCGVFCQI